MKDPARWATDDGGAPDSLRGALADATNETTAPLALASLAARLDPVLGRPHVPSTFGLELSVVAFAVGLAGAAAGLAVREPTEAMPSTSHVTSRAIAEAPEVPEASADVPPEPDVPPPARPASRTIIREEPPEPIVSTPAPPSEPESASPPDVERGPSEVALLDEARSAVVREPARALALTMEHVRRFPSGMLVEERELLAVEALVRLGRRPMADARAAHFRATHPSSVHLPRLERLLGTEIR